MNIYSIIMYEFRKGIKFVDVVKCIYNIFGEATVFECIKNDMQNFECDDFDIEDKSHSG